jgi:predicted nuclease with TOPRIM domain
MEAQIKSLKAENLSLKAQVKPLERNVERLEKRIEEASAKPKIESIHLGQLEKSIFETIALAPGRINAKQIAEIHKISEIKANVNLRALKEKGLTLMYLNMGGGPTIYSLSSDGEEWAVKNNIVK